MLNDFSVFLRHLWAILRLPPPTPVQLEIAYYLQHGPRRKLIEAFRGVGKSWITSAYVVWKLWRNTESKFLVVSASRTRADDFSTFCHRLIKEVPILKHLQPRDGQRSSKISWDIGPARAAHQPSVKSLGINSQLTGTRATDVVSDDVEVPNNSWTQTAREKLDTLVQEFEAILAPGGSITYLGTPQTEESLYNKLRDRGYTPRIWPAQYPDPAKIEVYHGYLAPSIMEAVEKNPSIAGQPVDPKRFHTQELMERQIRYGITGYALQFMLDTTLSDLERYPLRLKDLIVMDLNWQKAPLIVQYGSGPDQKCDEFPNVGFSGDGWFEPLWIDNDTVPYDGIVMAVDPSGTGQDETGYAVVGQLHGQLFLLDAGGLKGGYDEPTLVKLSRIASDYKPNTILIESNFGDGMFAALWRPVLDKYHQCRLEDVRHNTRKEERIISALEPVMARHKLIMNKTVVRKEMEVFKADKQTYSLFYQMTRMVAEPGALRHDDRIDALAMAVRYWTNAMAQDEEEQAARWEEDMLMRDLEEFIADFPISKTQGGSWLDNVGRRI